MILPPLVIDVCVREQGSRSFRIWFPFFLLWPLLLIVVGFALLVTLLVDLASIMSGGRYHRYTALLLGTLRLLAEVRGTHADIRNSNSFVRVDII